MECYFKDHFASIVITGCNVCSPVDILFLWLAMLLTLLII